MKKKIKTFGKAAGLVLVILGIVLFGLVFNRPDRNIIGVVPQYNSPEFQRIQAGLEEEAKKAGYELIVKVPEEMTVQAQRKVMEELVEEGADCILLEAVAEGGFQDVLDECKIQEIPVLTYNSRVNSQDIYTEVLPYPIESAADAILFSMEENIEKSGQFGVLSSTSQDFLREARTREMLYRLEGGSYPDLHFTGTGFVKEEETLVAEKTEQLKKKYPDLEYLICYSTVDACGVAKYKKENELDWKMICEASLEEFGPEAPEGTIVLTYDYNRYGHFLMWLAMFAIETKSLPVAGETFEGEDGLTYMFEEKWQWGADEPEESGDFQSVKICSITMQEKPDVMIREENEWK